MQKKLGLFAEQFSEWTVRECHPDTEYHKLSQAKNACVVNEP